MTKRKKPAWRPAPAQRYRPRNPEVTSRMMAAVRSTGNRAEVALRKVLWRRGLRYRLYRADVVGHPDLLFPRARVAVFVDGDFWHGRGLVEDGVARFRATLRTKRREWWIQKLRRNVERDREVVAALRASGWRVVRVWESDVWRRMDRIADRIVALVSRRRGE